MSWKALNLFFFVTICVELKSQALLNESQLEIGNPCPEFALKGIQYYGRTEAKLKDFTGKDLILDFFATGCSYCFASFPKLNHLKKNFEGKVEFILVGREDKYIRASYEKFRQKQHLELPVVFDSALCNKWNIHGFPFVIWIDRKGVVKAISDGSSLTEENVEAFMNGRPFEYIDQSALGQDKLQDSYNYQMPLLSNGNGGPDNDFLYRVVIAPWRTTTLQWYHDEISSDEEKGRYQGTGITLMGLYNLAYVGKVNWTLNDSLYRKFLRFPILEIQDSTLFQYDFSAGKNIYSYSMYVPIKDKDPRYLQQVMRRELKNCFNYDVCIETRKMPYWKLVVSKDANLPLKSKGGKFYIDGSHAGISFKNASIRSLLWQIWNYHQNDPRPFIDETGINYTIDISIDALFTDLEDIKKALHKNGLELIQGEKEFKVIVIRNGNVGNE
jgi:thiol-disulfide isomerase/thioredoxin